MVREPAVAGKFYSANPDVLRSDLSSYLSPAHERVFATGCIAPHAGYMYSGRVAGAVFSSSRAQMPSTSSAVSFHSVSSGFVDTAMSCSRRIADIESGHLRCGGNQCDPCEFADLILGVGHDCLHTSMRSSVV